MNEHLFKLKKDGKCVGYAHINGYGQLMFRLPNDSDWYCKDSFWPMLINRYGFGIPTCSYHPFVTKDKNGKDVFAGDKVKRVNYTGDPQPREKAEQEGIVVWHHGFLQWSLKIGSENSYHLEDLADSEIFEDGIELIEEKEDV